jgi:hypothetical protein
MSHNNDVPDDPLLKPASEAGWDVASGEAKPAEDKLAAVDDKPADMPPADATPGDKPAHTDVKLAELRVDDEAILPAKSSENDLRAAIGASPISPSRRRRTVDHEGDDDDDDVDHRPRSLKTIATIVLSIAVGVAIVIFVILGRANMDRFALLCEAERAVPQQGRAFPPWGFHAISGEAWHPLAIAPETRCQSRETDDIRALERGMLAMLLDEANTQLTAHDLTKLDATESLLKQSLLLTRPAAIAEPETLAADRIAQHKEIERLLGDVTYWRAAARLREAANALTDASKQFDSAAAQHPRHVNDAGTWSTYVRKLADQLRIGPAGGPPTAITAPSASASPTPVATAEPAPAASAPATTAPSPITDTPASVPAPAAPGSPAPTTTADSPPHPAEPAAATTTTTTTTTIATPPANIPGGGVLL